MASSTPEFSRRDFVKGAALTLAAVPLSSALRASGSGDTAAAAPHEEARVRWLDGGAGSSLVGTTLGIPWPMGSLAAATPFEATSSQGPVPVQTWPLATWPDGSLKWTAHALAPSPEVPGEVVIRPGSPAAPRLPVTVTRSGAELQVDTGVIRCRISPGGEHLFEEITRNGRPSALKGRLVCLRQDSVEGATTTQESFGCRVSAVEVEQSGPVRAVIRIEGTHASPSRSWLPFTVRLYFHAGSDAVRLMHSFVFDGDAGKDFIRGLGIRFTVPLADQTIDRHLRFAGEGRGLWTEAVRNLTGLRRDAGRHAVQAQRTGASCGPVSSLSRPVREGLAHIPEFGDFSLYQSSADSFEVRKRTREGFCWLTAGHGHRARGLGYVGGPSGGVGFGLRDFWQRHPTELEISGAAGPQAEVTAWLWSPRSEAMDLRFYHDGMGQDTYEKQLEGLDITYEDYEPGFGSATGIARSSELTLWALSGTPSAEVLEAMADTVATPPVLVCTPAHYHRAGVFGGIWALPRTESAAARAIEERNARLIGFYQSQIEERRWYGFWNYGDVMHTYDADRHGWRYDVGGFAWDNSELSTDMWLWYSFLRSGRADIFRMAEAMTRHTGEVDVYHLGRFAGLGTRHGVVHWGDSAKQVRVSTAIYRRFYYYLTADERVGDLLREVRDCDVRLIDINPQRKVKQPAEPNPYPAFISIGTDWCSFLAAWLTEWERTGNTVYRDKILAGMTSIAASPSGWFSPVWGYDPKTGRLHATEGGRISVSHLNAVFGAVEINAELLRLLNVPEYERAWLRYCELYSASPAEQEKVLGTRLHDNSLTGAHSRLTAYLAHKTGSAALAERAWKEFARGDSGRLRAGLEPVAVSGPEVLSPVHEATEVSTNDTAQWGLAAVQNLAMIGERL